MGNPDQFARRMARISQGVVMGAARSARNTGIAAIEVVTKATPVDTTLTRSNWVASIGAPDLSERRIRSRVDVITEARKNLSLDIIRKEIFSRDSVEIHIANGGEKIPWLEWLNKGTSRQAPVGFVGIARDEVKNRNVGQTRLLTMVRGSLAKGI